MADDNETLAFLTALSSLAIRLAEERIVLHSMSYQSQGFGGWELEAGRWRNRVLVAFSGKDRQLRVSTAAMAPGSSARPWQVVEGHDYRSRRPDLQQLFSTVHKAVLAHIAAP
jgi:hypothetical protein